MRLKKDLGTARRQRASALIFLVAAFLMTAGCSSDERAWKKARQADTLLSYAAYAAASPRGKHVGEAFRIMEDMRREGTADGIFKDLVKTYDERFKPSGTAFTVLEKTATAPERAEKPFTVPPPPPPPASQPVPRGTLIVPAGKIPGIVLTALPDGDFRLNRTDVAPDALDTMLKDVFLARVDKTLFFRFLRPVKDYRELVDFMDRLIKAGAENPVPIITPQIKDIVWKEFEGTVSLPILDERISMGDDGILDPQEAAAGEEGGVVGGVLGGVPGGIPGGVPGGVAGGVSAAPETPIRLAEPPKLVKRLEPVYPEIARQARAEATVVIEATIDTYGRVFQAKVLRSNPLLDQAALDAVRKWVYEPVLVDGRPRPAVFPVPVRFELPKTNP